MAKSRKKKQSGLWLIISAVVALLILLVVILIYWAMQPSQPVKVTYQEALAAFRTQNVSDLIAPYLAEDFSSGNYSLVQLDKKYPGFEKDIRAVDVTLRSAAKEVLATVDGEAITRSDLNKQAALLPEQYRILMGDAQILQQMIDERVLLHEARRRFIEPTAAEVETAYQDLLSRGQLTEEELGKNLAGFGLVKDDLLTMLRRQLTITMLFNATTEQIASIPESELRAYYDENKDLFTTSASVTVRHILIAVDNATDDEAARATAEKALAEYKSGADFCVLVENYTTDRGSKETCGEYTFGKGYMVPEFEEAAFALKPNQTRIVKTQFGYHVILKLGQSPEELRSFDEVKEDIRSQLLSERRLTRYQETISALRENATITNKLAEPEPSAISPAEPAINVTEQPIEPAQNSEPKLQVDVEPANATVAVPSEPVAATPTALTAFASCLKEKGVVLYTTSWAADSQNEVDKFHEGAPELRVIDCTEQGCEGVEAFPAWKVAGKVVYGTMTFDQLAKESGCARP